MTKRIRVSVSPEPERYLHIVKSLGLAIGQNVRFRRNGVRWHTGKITGASKDGSVELVDDAGRMRAIMPEYVWVQETTVRGKKKWVPLRSDSTC